jgi:hypothetical protein
VTTAIAQFMRELERAWDAHRDALLVRRRAEVLVIAVVGFDRVRIRSQRVLWDHATLATQLGIACPVATGQAASGPAR